MSLATIPQTMKAFRLHDTGETLDVLSYDEIPVPSISDCERLIKNRYAGVNFLENYFRTGFYPVEIPSTVGSEASGVVVKVGQNVKGYVVGDLVAYGSTGTFSQYTFLNAVTVKAFKLPSGTTEEQLQLFSGLFVQGFTAVTFVHDAFKVRKGQFILVHAAAGGLGLLLTQLIQQKGAHVIATASTSEKLELAKAVGAEYLINSKTEDTVSKVKEITQGKGVNASFDGVGKDTFEISMESLAVNGTLISFGSASGPGPPFSVIQLTPKKYHSQSSVVLQLSDQSREGL